MGTTDREEQASHAGLDATTTRPQRTTVIPHVVIVGGGFGGLMAALSLRRAAVRLTLIDRSNHHVFQPLLYQVATAALSPAQIAAPIRHILAKQPNCTVWMAEATRVDASRRTVMLTDGELPYDYLVLAAGATHSYFGHAEWARYAPGLKTVADAVEIRQRLLLAFEQAERLSTPEAQQPYLTFVIVGGGPTGVEMAGAISEIACETARRDFRNIDTANTRVILVEATERLLGSYPEALARRAEKDLAELGVEVRLRSRVTLIDGQAVTITTAQGTEVIPTRNVLWAAGVQANPLGATIGVPLDRNGRVPVESDLSVPGHPEIFVIGDLAHAKEARTGHPVPALAPAALQMGRHVAGIISAETGRRPRERSARPGFQYADRGLLATIGRKRAIAALGPFQFAGLLAWLLWCIVHIFFLITFRQKVLVMIEWIWSYVTFTGGARLITSNTWHPTSEE
jgi:NADH dehydrogenase